MRGAIVPAIQGAPRPSPLLVLPAGSSGVDGGEPQVEREAAVDEEVENEEAQGPAGSQVMGDADNGAVVGQDVA